MVCSTTGKHKTESNGFLDHRLDLVASSSYHGSLQLSTVNVRQRFLSDSFLEAGPVPVNLDSLLGFPSDLDEPGSPDQIVVRCGGPESRVGTACEQPKKSTLSYS